jgi:hypothetical protein
MTLDDLPHILACDRMDVDASLVRKRGLADERQPLVRLDDREVVDEA